MQQYFYRSQCLNEQYFRLSCSPDEYLTAGWKMARDPSRSKTRQTGFSVTDRDLPTYRRRPWIRLTEL